MSLKTFKFESLAAIEDGALMVAVNHALQQAYLDCADRPEVRTARKVSFEISMIPSMAKGELDRVRVAFAIKKAMPTQGMEVSMKPGRDGLEFQPAISDNPDQIPLPFEQNSN